MASPDQTRGNTRSGAKRIRIDNCTVCTLVEGVPAGVNVRVRATSVRTARTRAAEIMDHLLEGTTVLGPGDFDLTDGESVRWYLDGALMLGDCPVHPESWDA